MCLCLGFVELVETLLQQFAAPFRGQTVKEIAARTVNEVIHCSLQAHLPQGCPERAKTRLVVFYKDHHGNVIDSVDL
jgi:hypothetical protein